MIYDVSIWSIQIFTQHAFAIYRIVINEWSGRIVISFVRSIKFFGCITIYRLRRSQTFFALTIATANTFYYAIIRDGWLNEIVVYLRCCNNPWSVCNNAVRWRNRLNSWCISNNGDQQTRNRYCMNYIYLHRRLMNEWAIVEVKNINNNNIIIIIIIRCIQVHPVFPSGVVCGTWWSPSKSFAG